MFRPTKALKMPNLVAPTAAPTPMERELDTLASMPKHELVALAAGTPQTLAKHHVGAVYLAQQLYLTPSGAKSSIKAGTLNIGVPASYIEAVYTRIVVVDTATGAMEALDESRSAHHALLHASGKLLDPSRVVDLSKFPFVVTGPHADADSDVVFADLPMTTANTLSSCDVALQRELMLSIRTRLVQNAPFQWHYASVGGDKAWERDIETLGRLQMGLPFDEVIETHGLPKQVRLVTTLSGYALFEMHVHKSAVPESVRGAPSIQSPHEDCVKVLASLTTVNELVRLRRLATDAILEVAEEAWIRGTEAMLAMTDGLRGFVFGPDGLELINVAAVGVEPLDVNTALVSQAGFMASGGHAFASTVVVTGKQLPNNAMVRATPRFYDPQLSEYTIKLPHGVSATVVSPFLLDFVERRGVQMFSLQTALRITPLIVDMDFDKFKVDDLKVLANAPGVKASLRAAIDFTAFGYDDNDDLLWVPLADGAAPTPFHDLADALGLPPRFKESMERLAAIYGTLASKEARGVAKRKNRGTNTEPLPAAVCDATHTEPLAVSAATSTGAKQDFVASLLAPPFAAAAAVAFPAQLSSASPFAAFAAAPFPEQLNSASHAPVPQPSMPPYVPSFDNDDAGAPSASKAAAHDVGPLVLDDVESEDEAPKPTATAVTQPCFDAVEPVAAKPKKSKAKKSHKRKPSSQAAPPQPKKKKVKTADELLLEEAVAAAIEEKERKYRLTQSQEVAIPRKK